jgi:hypothetical protein
MLRLLFDYHNSINLVIAPITAVIKANIIAIVFNLSQISFCFSDLCLGFSAGIFFMLFLIWLSEKSES